MTEADVADLPPETWRDGKFNFDDYLTESVRTGTIEVFETEDDAADKVRSGVLHAGWHHIVR